VILHLEDSATCIEVEGVEEGDPVLPEEVESCEEYTIVVAVEPLAIVNIASVAKKMDRQTENPLSVLTVFLLLFLFIMCFLFSSDIQLPVSRTLFCA
jgi:hypothetical protein